MEDEFIKKLKEKYENGEISEETYKEILDRYMQGYKEEKGSGEGSEGESGDVSGERPKRRNGVYQCAGSCVLDEGTYEDIQVSGSLKINGEIYAEKIAVAGAVKSENTIHADSFKCSGAVKISGDVYADRIQVAGSFIVRNVKGDELKIAGSVIAQELRGDRLSLDGHANVKLIKVDSLKMKLSKDCRVDKIIGDQIEIVCDRGFFRKCRGSLKCNEILGDEIYVESVVANRVEGDKVVIGDDCKIGTVKGSDVKVSKRSTVGKVIEDE